MCAYKSTFFSLLALLTLPVYANREGFAEILSKPVRKMSLAEAISGRYDDEPTRITVTIRDIYRDVIDPEYRFLVLSSSNTLVNAAMSWPYGDDRDLMSLIGAEVSVLGFASPHVPDWRRLTGRLYHIDKPQDIRVLKPAPSNPQDIPPIDPDIRLQPEDLPSLGRRSFTGRVIAVWQGHSLLLADSSDHIVRADLSSEAPPACGESVTVVGLPESDLYYLNLNRATWRPAAEVRHSPSSTTNISPRVILRDNQDRRRMNPSFHGRAIRLSGVALSMPGVGDANGILYLESDGFIVPVDVSASPEAIAGVSVGCSLDITGICVMQIDKWRPNAPFPDIHGFTLVVREPTDVRITAFPPWWTPARMLVVVLTLIAVIVAVLIWNRSLKVLAERCGRELMDSQIGEIRSTLKVEERTRLAVELHDSLSQTLTGVSMELETARELGREDATALWSHLDVADRTLESCRNGLRDCLWDLRSQALELPDLNEAILMTMKPYVRLSHLAVRFNVPRSLLSDDMTYALLRTVRELAVNAIRHGNATEVRIAGSIEQSTLKFSVTDNGCGFDPANAPGVLQAHFGLQGIRERINRLGGSFRIDSRIGCGCRAVLAIPLPEQEES